MECLEDEFSSKPRIFFGMYFPTFNKV
jgi:hypothetical protein